MNNILNATPAEVLMDEKQAGLFRYWRSLHPLSGGLPLKSEFDPLSVPRLLSSLVIAEIEDDDLRFRLVGTDMVEFWGEDFTGKPLREIMQGEYGDYIYTLFHTCADSKRAVLSGGRFRWDVNKPSNTVRLMVPFAGSDDRTQTRYVIVCQTFYYGSIDLNEPFVKIID